MGEIALYGLHYGEVVIMDQPSLDAAVARMKLRASQFASVRDESAARRAKRQRA